MDGNGTARSGVTAREIRKKKSLVFDFSIGSRGGSQLWRTNPLGFEQNISRCVSVCWLNPGFRSNWIRGCASLIFHSSSFSRSLSREEGLLPSRRFATTCSNGTPPRLFSGRGTGSWEEFLDLCTMEKWLAMTRIFVAMIQISRSTTFFDSTIACNIKINFV